MSALIHTVHDYLAHISFQMTSLPANKQSYGLFMLYYRNYFFSFSTFESIHSREYKFLNKKLELKIEFNIQKRENNSKPLSFRRQKQNTISRAFFLHCFLTNHEYSMHEFPQQLTICVPQLWCQSLRFSCWLFSWKVQAFSTYCLGHP